VSSSLSPFRRAQARSEQRQLVCDLISAQILATSNHVRLQQCLLAAVLHSVCNLSVLEVAARRIRDDAHHEFFCEGHVADRHLVHDRHPDDRPALTDCYDQVLYHDRLSAHPDALHLGHDLAHHDLEKYDHLNQPGHDQVATPEFVRCVRSLKLCQCVAAHD
jgi:hypothetical protein